MCYDVFQFTTVFNILKVNHLYSLKSNLFAAGGILNNEKTVTAMRAVDRKNYAKGVPYQDAPQGIGYGVTISAPHMVRIIYST